MFQHNFTIKGCDDLLLFGLGKGVNQELQTRKVTFLDLRLQRIHLCTANST